MLRPLVEAGSYAVAGRAASSSARPGLWFPARPDIADVEVDHERRPVVLTTGAPWRWTGRVPPRAVLHAGVQLDPAAWQRVRRLQAVAAVRSGREREVLQVARASAGEGQAWLDLSADLGRYAGRRVTIELSATLARLPPRLRGVNLVAWGPVSLTSAGGGGAPLGAPAPIAAAAGSRSAAAAGRLAPRRDRHDAEAAERPNVILILVDTLRRDRLTPYGYRRETSPEIGRRLAAAGTVMEDAYSQAPWTLPSVVSLMTGRYPGELLSADPSSYGIPAAVQPLAERLEGAGFETAGFIANPTMHVGASFERGFRTFYAPPAEVEWLRHHADDVNRHALPWIASHQDQGRPFFLYLHYIDPHDPYDNPEIVGNRSPFESEYKGPVAGDWVNGFYTGGLTLPDPARDLPHVSALYDSEVHYVDRAIGEVLAGLRPEVLANTLVVLTADHGEELLDHGGWKHGQSLYGEQIHVPLIWRWDRRIPAGRRLKGTVRLLDVAPTLAAAAGAMPDPGWQGMDLLPELTGARPLAARPVFAEGLSSGPLLAAAVLGRRKLIVFNRTEPFTPDNAMQNHLWRLNLGRLARVELYDLERDPGELHNLAPPADSPRDANAVRGSAAAEPADPQPTATIDGLKPLAAIVERRLDAGLPGLRLLAAGVPSGSRLRVELTLTRSPLHWIPWLLTSADRVTVDGARLTLELRGGDSLARGVRIEGDFTAGGAGPGGAGRLAPLRDRDHPEAAVRSLSAALDGRPLPPGSLRAGAGAPYPGGSLPPAGLRARRWPESLAAAVGGGAGPVVALWLHDAAGTMERRQGHDAETERRLRALGYL